MAVALFRGSSKLPLVEIAIQTSATLTERRYHKWLTRFAWFTAFATLLLVCSGGMVTSKNVGLAVPDWPTTFGYNMFLFPVSKWIGGVLFEHTHRLIASTVGMLTLVLSMWLWARETEGTPRWTGWALMILGVGVLGARTQPIQICVGSLAIVTIFFGIWRSAKTSGVLRWFGVIALGAVILQGVLGGLRVVMLKDQIGIFHACLAQAFLGLLVFIALSTTRFWQSLAKNLTVLSSQVSGGAGKFKTMAFAITGLIYLQLILGATMRHQHRDLAILDFPTANGSWIPDTSASALEKINAWRDMRALSDVTAFQIWLQMVHRLVAVVIAMAIVAFCLRVWRDAHAVSAVRRLSLVWVVFVFGQIALGAWTVWSNKAADIATAHVAVGAIMLSLGVSISAICLRLRNGLTDCVSRPSLQGAAAT